MYVYCSLQLSHILIQYVSICEPSLTLFPVFGFIMMELESTLPIFITDYWRMTINPITR